MKPDQTNFKIWDSRYDFSEIDKFNYHQVLKDYFHLTTKKITLIAMLLVLEVVFGLISHYALGLVKVGGFLTFNITIWITFIAFMAFNFFYSFLLLEVSIWFRVAYSGDVIGAIAINLNDLTFLLCLALVSQLVNFIRFKIQKDYSLAAKKRIGYFWSLMISLIVTALLTSTMDVIYNYGFMIAFYNALFNLTLNPSGLGLLITIFWFNIVQGVINIIIFASIYKACYSLINSYFLQKM